MKATHIDKQVIDWKGISSFLIITFVVTYAIEEALILSGISLVARGVGST